MNNFSSRNFSDFYNYFALKGFVLRKGTIWVNSNSECKYQPRTIVELMINRAESTLPEWMRVNFNFGVCDSPIDYNVWKYWSFLKVCLRKIGAHIETGLDCHPIPSGAFVAFAMSAVTNPNQFTLSDYFEQHYGILTLPYFYNNW